MDPAALEEAIQGQKDLLSQLMQQKELLEQEIGDHISYLNQPGNPGLSGGLIDNEGFPIHDTAKVISIRDARHNLACKQNDHKALMKTLEQNLYQLHALTKTRTTAGTTSPSAQAIVHTTPPPKGDPLLEVPAFCKVNSVMPGSPASESGLQAGDEVIKFGNVDHTNHNNLQAIKNVVLATVNSPLLIIVKRTGTTIVRLNLIPHTWSGPGLLGCHLLPLN